MVHVLHVATSLICYINMDAWCLFSLGTSVVCMQNGSLMRWCNSAALGFMGRAALVPANVTPALFLLHHGNGQQKTRGRN